MNVRYSYSQISPGLVRPALIGRLVGHISESIPLIRLLTVLHANTSSGFLQFGLRYYGLLLYGENLHINSKRVPVVRIAKRSVKKICTAQ